MALTGKNPGFVAAIFGVTGLVGNELAKKLLSTRKWKVYGIARKTSHHFVIEDSNFHFISFNLLNSKETQVKLSLMEDLTHVFWITWSSQFPLDSRECFEQNKAMMSNALNAILPSAKSLKHVSLQTGTKHYVALQGDSVKDIIFDESSPRVSFSQYNFYYGLEDLLQERLPGYDVAWSIHRPGLIMGCSDRTVYNFIGSLCVYGTICKYLKLSFMFGGTRQCWEEMSVDASDARLVAEQHIWASTSVEVGKGQAFNAINGESYSWKEMWGPIGVKFGANVDKGVMLFSEDFSFSLAMKDKGEIWKDIVVKEGLVKTEMEDLANWDFLDILFRCPVKMLGSRDKADRMGFNIKYCALDSIFYWIDVMRARKIIP